MTTTMTTTPTTTKPTMLTHNGTITATPPTTLPTTTMVLPRRPRPQPVFPWAPAITMPAAMTIMTTTMATTMSEINCLRYSPPVDEFIECNLKGRACLVCSV